MGDMAKGRVSVGGTLDASAPNGGDGGFIETSAAKVAFADRLNITTAAANGKTGQWLIDPVDFTVAASGGDITGSALGTMLGSNSVTIQTANTGTNTATEVFGTTGTNGDIFVNDSVTWSSANTLTLNAHRNIEINSPITASHASGKLALKYGQGEVAEESTATYTIRAPITLQSSGAANGNNGTNQTNFSITFGSDGTPINYTVLNSQDALQAMTLNGNYALGSSLTFSGNWTPIGNEWSNCTTMFCGSFDGLGNTINNLSTTGLVSPNWGDGLGGLFGATLGATIRNLNLANAAINLNALTTNTLYIGTLVGVAEHTYIHNVTATGGVTAPLGKTDYTGGLVGYIYGAQSRIDSSHAAVNLSAGEYVGGLLGYAAAGSVTQSSASGNVIQTSSPYGFAGGLVGYNVAAIRDSYAIGTVTGEGEAAGGLVGKNYTGGSITSAYAAGAVAGGTHSGGLVGSNSGTVTNGYWDNETTGKAIAFGANSNAQSATALVQETNNAYTQTEYTGFDFTSTWWMADGATRPFLRSEWRQNITNAHELQLIAMKLDHSYSLANDINLAPSLTNPSEMWKGTAVGSSFQGSWKPIGSLRPLVYDTAEEEWTASGSDRPFVGVFDGKNNSITGLTIQRPTELPGSPAANEALDSSGVGLFGYVSGSSSEIRDLKLIDPVVKGYQNVGAVVGFMEEGNLRHLTVENIAVQGGGYYVGGVVGSLGGNATGLLASGGQVTGAASGMGGVIGYNEGSVTQSSADVNVTSQRDEAGGLVGHNSGTITASSASGAVSGKGQVGGLVGYSDGSIVSSHALGNVTNTGTSDGAGGLVGTSEGSITDSYASGNVTSLGASYAGGLVGYSDGNISLSYASGEVRGEYGVGGLVGWANSWSGTLNTIEKSHASGLVIATDENSGGLVGIAEGTKIENSYASGSVSGTRTVGGLVGSFGGESRVGGPQIINSYAIGPVTGTSNVGGLVGYDSSLRTNAYNSVVSSFWDKQTTGQTTSAGGIGKTTAEMQDITLYSGWSIEDDTSLTSSYARLTMTATGTVWKIKSVANTNSSGGDTDSSGTNNNGGSGSGTGSGDQGAGSSGTGSSGTGSSGTGSLGTGSLGTGSLGTGSSGSGSESSASGGTGGATDTATGSNGGANTGGSSENADSVTQSLQLAAAIQSAQQAAQQAARQAAGGSDPSSTGPGRSSVPTSALTGFNPGLALGTASATGAAAGGSPAVLSLSGGLAFVNVNASPAESTGSGGQATGNAVAAMPEGAGRDPAGFMRVFVVNGGINLPTQASDAAVPGQGVN